MDAVKLLVTKADFDPGAEIALLSAGDGDSGALASFIGLVRGATDGVSAMTLEHYPGMTEREIAKIVAEAQTRWRLDRVTVIHRVGRLLAGERIVFVGVAARHRAEAFAACERWVEAREADDERALRWER
jgi:molybdopterin synthase catalytic subunit